MTGIWLAVCLYLSWQTGEETGQFSQRIARFLLEMLGRLGLQLDAQSFHAGLRLFAHFGVLFVTGGLFAGALEVSLDGGKRTNLYVFMIGSSVCAVIAVAAEVGKLVVPGRHLTWSETGLSVLGAVAGVAAMCLAVRLFLRRSRPRN